MIKLSSEVKRTPFELTSEDGNVEKLYVGQFTAADGLRMHELQHSLAKDNKLTFAHVSIARVVTGVKREDGSYYWDVGSLDEFNTSKYPDELIAVLAEMVTELNPINITDTIKSKKKSS